MHALRSPRSKLLDIMEASPRGWVQRLQRLAPMSKRSQEDDTVHVRACCAMSGAPDSATIEQLRAAYRKDGVVVVRRAFSVECVERLRAIVPSALSDENEDLERYSDDRDAGFVGEMDCSRKYPEFQDYVFESPAAEVAARVIGSPSLNFFYDFLFVKEPGTASRTPWQYDKLLLDCVMFLHTCILLHGMFVVELAAAKTLRTGTFQAQILSQSGCRWIRFLDHPL